MNMKTEEKRWARKITEDRVEDYRAFAEETLKLLGTRGLDRRAIISSLVCDRKGLFMRPALLWIRRIAGYRTWEYDSSDEAAVLYAREILCCNPDVFGQISEPGSREQEFLDEMRRGSKLLQQSFSDIAFGYLAEVGILGDGPSDREWIQDLSLTA